MPTLENETRTEAAEDEPIKKERAAPEADTARLEKERRFVEALEKLPAIFREVIARIARDPEATGTLPDSLPETVQEIKALLQRLDRDEDGLAGEEDANFSLLEKVSEKIEKISILEAEDITRTGDLLSYGGEVLSVTKKADLERLGLVDTENTLKENLISARIREAGFASREELGDAATATGEEIEKLSGQTFGLGRFIHHKELDQLQEKLSALIGIESETMFVHKKTAYSKKYEIGRAGETLLNAATEQVSSSIERVEKALRDTYKESTPDATVLSNLTETFFLKIVDRAIIEFNKAAYPTEQSWKAFYDYVENVDMEVYFNRVTETCTEINALLKDVRGLYGLGRARASRYLNMDFWKTTARELNMDHWEIFKENPDIQKTLDARKISEFEKGISNALGEKLCTSARDDRDTLAQKMFMLGRIEAAPLLILQSFWSRAHGGSFPFVGRRNNAQDPSILGDYLSKLSPEDLGKIPNATPELLKILRFVQENPSKDLERIAEGPRNHLPDTDPEVTKEAEEIQHQLEALDAHFLRNGSDAEKQFAVAMIVARRKPLGALHEPLYEMLANHPAKDSFSEILTNHFHNTRDFDTLYVGCKADIFNDLPDGILSTIAYDWPKVIYKSENKIEELVLVKDSLARALEGMAPWKNPFLKENSTRTFLAFLAAEALGIGPQPTKEDIISLLGRRDEVLSNTSGNRMFDTRVAATLARLGKDFSFTESEAYQVCRALIQQHGRDDETSDETLDNFLEKLPAGKILTEHDVAFTETFRQPLVTKDMNFLELTQDPDLVLVKSTWLKYLNAYTLVEGGQMRIPQAVEKTLPKLFSNERPENRTFCLGEVRNLWKQHLEAGVSMLPLEAVALGDSMRRAGGQVGDLKYITALLDMMSTLDALSQSAKTASRTQQELQAGLQSQEQRMEKWGEDERAAFYTISADIMRAAPSLYSRFLTLFESMSGNGLKTFAKEVFPLYHANLIVLENSSGKKGVAFEPRELVGLRRRITDLEKQLGKEGADKEVVIGEERARTMRSLQENFKKRTGLKKIPENITPENLHSLQNHIRYLGNINERDPEKEAIVSLFLGLSINGEWASFRAGEQIALEDYFEGEPLKILEGLMKKSGWREAATSALALQPEESSGFWKSLQEETITNVLGNIQTIDLKLGAAQRGLEDLYDPDIYPDESDRLALTLMREEGKSVGGLLSKIYREADGKKVSFSPEEQALRSSIEKQFSIPLWTKENVKELQLKLQVPGLLGSTMRKLEEEGAEGAIEKLQGLVDPSAEIIALFKRMDEEFAPRSGALALGQDLNYLENIVVKNEDKLTPEEKELVSEYLGNIRSQMAVLESLYARVKEYFAKIEGGIHVSKNEILKNRVGEIKKLLSQSDEAVNLTTRMTSDMNLIIENMRQCLGCLNKEVNNDTNLTFGDGNKFFIMSQRESDRASVADQIVFLSPVEYAGGIREASFVMDQLYGTKSSDVLLAHMQAVIKKCSALKKAYPNAKLSVFVTNEALMSAGLNTETATQRLEAALTDRGTVSAEKQGTVAIPASAFGDHYIEFGGQKARSNDPRATGGIKIAF